MKASTIFSAHDMLTMCMTLLSYSMCAHFEKSEVYHLRAYFYKTTDMMVDIYSGTGTL